MHAHKRFTFATDVQVYFCVIRVAPGSAVQTRTPTAAASVLFKRNRLLACPSELPECDALRLNQRPRKTLGFETPADRLQAVLH